MSKSVPYVHRDERTALHAFRYSRHSDNPHCMNLLLDFIEMEFGLQPVESPGESITFLPAFVAIVGTALWDTSIWVSLYGKERDFGGLSTVVGQYRNWRKFQVQNRDADIEQAKKLIRCACENYKRDHTGLEWLDLVVTAEERWLDNRERELRKAQYRAILRDL